MNKKKILTYILLGLCLLFLIGNIITSVFYIKNYNVYMIINYIILILFTLFLAFHVINTKENKYVILNISLVFLMIYNISLLNGSFYKTNVSPLKKLSSSIMDISFLKTVPDFSDHDLTTVIKWAQENNISISEVYEYSDITKEQSIIYQDVKAGTNLSKVESITVVVSDGPNPVKEIMLKDMTGYNIEDVLNFVEENYLNNVKIVYEESDDKEDSLINQSKIGTITRSDEIIFTFSLGPDSKNDYVKLIDFTNMSKLRAMAYLEKYKIDYEFNTDYSSNITKGNVLSQSIKKGSIVKKDGTKLTLTISKGKKVKVPNLKEMSFDEILEWISKNKLKLEIDEKIDDSIKKGNVISCSVNQNDIIEEKSKIKIILSKGQIKMKEFKDLDSFKEWVNKYGINYQIEYEASDEIENGQIIKFSHKKNDVIKNDDTIIVTISSGKQTTVPNFVGLSKTSITKKCNSLELKCSFQYANSNENKDIAIRQSLTSGSKVATNTSISITLSNGKKPTNNSTSNKNNNTSSSNNNSNSNSSNNNSGNNNNSNDNTPTTPTTPTCTPESKVISRDLNNIFSNPESYQSVYNKLYSYFNNMNVNIKIVGDSSSGKAPGSFISGITPGTTVTTCCPNNCKTYTITIAK